MDNAIYIALSKQAAQFRQMDVIANNIANVNTGGYKAETMVFNDYLVNDGNKHKMAFAQDIATYRDTQAGGLIKTDGQLDVAIDGQGFFTVETPLGQRYPRAGNFQVDGNGTLVTMEGYPVLDAGGGRIEFQEGDDNVAISEEGFVLVNGDERGQIGVVQFANEQLLERLSGSLYKSDIPPQQAENYRVLQGVVESSNVKPVIEMTTMIKTSRSVTSTAKFIETMYELQRRAVRTTLGEQNA